MTILESAQNFLKYLENHLSDFYHLKKISQEFSHYLVNYNIAERNGFSPDMIDKWPYFCLDRGHPQSGGIRFKYTRNRNDIYRDHFYTDNALVALKENYDTIYAEWTDIRHGHNLKKEIILDFKSQSLRAIQYGLKSRNALMEVTYRNGKVSEENDYFFMSAWILHEYEIYYNLQIFLYLCSAAEGNIYSISDAIEVFVDEYLDGESVLEEKLSSLDSECCRLASECKDNFPGTYCLNLARNQNYREYISEIWKIFASIPKFKEDMLNSHITVDNDY